MEYIYTMRQTGKVFGVSISMFKNQPCLPLGTTYHGR